jgi:hypothetical protein
VNRVIVFLFSFASISAVAQVGGRTSFDFVQVPATSRLSALGGVNVSLADRDVNFFAANPALAGDTLSGVASANYQFYAGDIGHALFTYALPVNEKTGTLILGIQHIGYGDIQGYDATGIETNQFNSGETALLIGKNHQIGDFRLGATIKGVFSTIAGYRASAVMIDLGGVFIHPEKKLTIGLAIKNIGFVLDDYTSGKKSSVPFDVQLGATLKPEYMPLRFSFTAFNLTRPDVTYYNPDENEEKPGTFKKVLSHLNMGVEILLHKNVNLLAGYNYLAHQALKLNTGGSGAGLSFGFSAQVKAIEMGFSRNGFVAGSAGYTFTLSTNVNKLLKRQQRV